MKTFATRGMNILIVIAILSGFWVFTPPVAVAADALAWTGFWFS